MSDMPRWMMGDPMPVAQSKQQRDIRRGKRETETQGIEDLFMEPALTLGQIEQVEELLIVWYEYEASYRPALGAPRVSPSSREYRAGGAYDCPDETDALLDRVTAEAVGLCVDELTLQERAAIQVQMRNRVARAAIHRHPRTENQRMDYYSAREKLLGMLMAKGLIVAD